MLITGILFVGVTGIVRHLGSSLPAVEAAFIRYALGTLLILPVLFRAGFRFPARRPLTLYTLRGLAHGCAVILWFYAMARIPIAEVTAIGYTAPIFTTIGAAIFLGEALHMRRIMAVVIGFVGAMLIIRPGFQEIQLGSLAQLLAAPLFAISFLLAKRLTDTQNSSEVVLMLSIFCTLALLPGAMLQWQAPSGKDIFWLFLVAVLATSGHYTLTKAFASAPITVTQPISFLQLVWASLLGFFVFSEQLDVWVTLGGGIIVAAATYISHREAVAARIERKQELPLTG